MKKYLIMFFLLFFCAVLWGQEKRETLRATIQFKVNTDEIIEDAYFRDTLLPYLNKNIDYLEKLYIRSSASPEGTKERNKYLSDLRASRVLSLLPPAITNSVIESAGEDWKGLYQAVYNSSIPDKENILKALSREERITGRDKKLSEYLPALRSVYVEARFVFPVPCEDKIVIVRDTIPDIDTVYIEKPLKRYPVLGVKTNLLLDVVPYSPFGISFTPNIQLELYTWLWGLSLEFEYTFPWWHSDETFKYYQILNGCAGIRKYFNNLYNGWWVGLYGNTSIYDLCIGKDKGWQGELWGCGLGFGYVFQKGRLKFEPYLRLGYFNTRFDKYHAGEPFEDKYYYDWEGRARDFIPRRFNMNYFGPTMIGFNITFDLICVKRY